MRPTICRAQIRASEAVARQLRLVSNLIHSTLVNETEAEAKTECTGAAVLVKSSSKI